MPSTKYVGSSYPTHFLKVGAVLLGIIFFEYRTIKATHFARRNDFYALLAINKANIYSIGFLRAPVLTQFIVKV